MHQLHDDKASSLIRTRPASGGLGLALALAGTGFGAGTDFAGFEEAVFYEVGQAPAAIVAADLDADGAMDLLVPILIPATEGVSILYGRGDGTFEPEVRVHGALNDSNVAAADFTGDGIVDLMITSQVNLAGVPTGGVSLLRGLGDRRFAEPVFMDAGAQPFDITAGDLDDDGDIDFIVSNQLGGELSVFLNNGDGTFPPPTSLPTGAVPQSLVMIDMDGDGDLDVAVNHFLVNEIRVYLNGGDGAFTPLTPTPALQMLPRTLDAALLHGDAFPSVIGVAVVPAAAGFRALVFRNDGGALQRYEPFPDDVGDLRLLRANAGSFSLDGVPDIGVSGRSQSMSQFALADALLGDVDGGFELSGQNSMITPNTGGGVQLIADLDADGDSDLVFVPDVFLIAVLINTTRTPQTGDVNHDGAVDSADLATLLRAWGGAGPAADLNHDGVVDGADLAHLLANWTAPEGPADPSLTRKGTSP